jgi:hypothetical protein
MQLAGTCQKLRRHLGPALPPSMSLQLILVTELSTGPTGGEEHGAELHVTKQGKRSTWKLRGKMLTPGTVHREM